MMPEIIFARSRHEYTPYADFWRLVELSEFPIQFVDQIDWDKPCVVVGTPKNGEWSGIPVSKRAHFFWWNLERSKTDDPVEDMSNPSVPLGVDEVWASDRAMAHATSAKYVFLGGHEQFAALDMSNRTEFDIVTLAYWSHRRQAIKGDLFNRFTIADRAGSCWGDARHYALNHTRLMINTHQDDYPWSEPIRFALAAMYGIPLLSETCADPGHYERNKHYVSAPLLDIPSSAAHLLEHDMLMAALAANAWRLVVRERPFRKNVLEAVGEAVTA